MIGFFKNFQRVRVYSARSADGTRFIPLEHGPLGVVERLRRADTGAWIKLDQREEADVHPFAPDDQDGRGSNVLAFPEDCEGI